MKTYYIVEHRGLPVFVSSHQNLAEREAEQVSLPGHPARVVVVTHAFYLDEVANIVLDDWLTEEPTTPNARKECLCGPSDG